MYLRTSSVSDGHANGYCKGPERSEKAAWLSTCQTRLLVGTAEKVAGEGINLGVRRSQSLIGSPCISSISQSGDEGL